MESVHSALVCGLIAVVAIAHAAQEKSKENVVMQLYQVSKSDWDSRGQEEFVKLLVEEANTFCRSNSEDCYMNRLPSIFTADLYEQHDASNDKAYLVVDFSLKLPPTKDMVSGHDSDEYLARTALQKVTINSREKFRDETDWSIVDVDGEQGDLPPNSTLNIAISVTAVVILIALIITLCVMQRKCGKKSKHHKVDSSERVTVA